MKSTFTTRRLSLEHSESIIPHAVHSFVYSFIVLPLLIWSAFSFTVITAKNAVAKVEAMHPLRFALNLPSRKITLPRPPYEIPAVAAVMTMLDGDMIWQWDGAPEYKNERLAYYQRLLQDRGITSKIYLQILTAQLIQENGSLSESVHGDNGCSVGIVQYNACVHNNQNAQAFLRDHPEWKDWKYQMQEMAEMVSKRIVAYHGNIRLVVIAHNCPACAIKGKDSKAGYYQSVLSRTHLLSI